VAPVEDAGARGGGADLLEGLQFAFRDPDPRGEAGERLGKRRRRACGEVEAREPVVAEAERLRALREFLGLQLVAAVEERHRLAGLLGVDAERAEHAGDRDAMREPDLHVLRREPEPLEGENAAGDHVDIGGGAIGADEVDVPLEELAQAPPLRPLGAEHRRNREPLHRDRQRTCARRDHAGERRGELGAQRVVVLAARATEGEELVDDPLARLRGVELEVLEGRAVDLVEAAVDRRRAPRALDVAPHGEIAGVEVAGALRRLERVGRHGRSVAAAQAVCPGRSRSMAAMTTEASVQAIRVSAKFAAM